MLSWLMGVVLCLALLAGCGGGHKVNLVKMEPVPQETVALAPDVPDEAPDRRTERQAPGRALRQERHPRLGPQPGSRN